MLPSFLILFNLICFVSSKQIPVVDGVIGGVRTSTKQSATAPAPQVSGKPVAGKLRYVENSGVCGRVSEMHHTRLPLTFASETTAGVFQASGYADLTTSQHMWYVCGVTDGRAFVEY